MKKTGSYFLIAALILGIAGCGSKAQPETIKQEETTTKFQPITHEYVIPEGATGPADVTLHGDEYSNYPDDKKPGNSETEGISVLYYYVEDFGLAYDFDVVEGSELTAETLIGVLMRGGCLTEGTEVISFTVDGGKGVLELNRLEGSYVKAAPEQVAQAVANTFCDNLGLDEITIKAGEETYGPLAWVSIN